MTDKYFLIYDRSTMPRWCQLSRGKDEWIDFKGRPLPVNGSVVIAYVDAKHYSGTIYDVDEAVAELEKEFAYRYLLDPWSDQGWLAPNGKFWGCQFYQHDDIAYSLLRKSPATLEDEGWIRVHADTFITKESSRRITKRQINTLFELGFIDVDMLRLRDLEHKISRDAPPPKYAVMAPALLLLGEFLNGLDKEKTIEESLAQLSKVLIDEFDLGNVFNDSHQVISDVGPGTWMWMMQWDSFSIGSEEHPESLMASKGLHLFKSAFDTVEIIASDDHEFSIDDDARSLLSINDYKYNKISI